MAFNPTKEQSLAISEKGSILVSAAAGSGKTAVLVERVARMLTDRENPVSADKLLVVTFTNAAAAELRLRIEKRLAEEFDNNPSDLFLQKQRILISKAKICTIDSFCLDFIRENFEQSHLSPTFKIADNSTLHLLEKTALSRVANDCFDSSDGEFLSLLEFLGEDYDDSKFQKCIKQIFDFSRHIPFPNEWLKNVVNQYKAHTDPNCSVWYDLAIDAVRDLAVDALKNFDRAIKLLQTNDTAFEKYFSNYNYFYELSDSVLSLCENKDWDGILSVISSVKAPTCKNLLAEEKTDAVVSSIKLRDEGKATLKKIETIIYASKKEIAIQTEMLLPFVEKIVSLVIKYEETLYDLLKKQDLITFYIAEQTVLNMLAVFDNGEIKVSSFANDYISRYDAILVDEYQDTNSLQDTLFSILSNSGEKLFCVGDMKQCIYKFRGSNPMNFLNKKENAFNIKDRNKPADTLRIDLGCNFRSRPEICDFINCVFDKILYKENSDFDYDEKEKLIPMAEFESTEELKIETHLFDFESIAQDDENDYCAKIQAEAEETANIILETINKEPFLRGKDGLRKADFGDITILVRSMKDKGDVFIKTLKNRGIPVCAASSEVLESDEVQTLIALLKIINNPSDDIALVTVMTSVLFGFSINDIASFKVKHRRGKMISAITAAANNSNEKLASFLKLISKLRRKSLLMPISLLIDDIFEETNILNLYSVQENGEMRRLNLMCIQNLAASFENEHRKDLRGFINYLSEMDDKDLGLAVEGRNTVTVMSIHKSKGLQFPVCIVANTTNQFNFQDFSNPLLVSEEFGFSTTYYTEDKLKVDNYLLRTLIKHQEKRQQLAEELRVFYVALTRAEEKLILLASFKDLDKEVKKKIEEVGNLCTDGRVDYALFRKNNSYSDWIIEAHILNGHAKALLGKETNKGIFIHREVESLNKVTSVKETFEPDLTNSKNLKEIYRFEYPFKDLLEIQSKASVTEMVHKADNKLYRFTERPAFMQESGLSSAERGTAIHKVMQYADFSRCITDLESEIERLHEYFYLTDAEYEVVDKEKLKAFFSSNLCSRIISAENVKKEMRFITEFPATEINKDLDARFADEMIVVQGAVDLIFEDGGKIHILDFKTDRNKSEEELLSAYSEQLKIYAKACEKLYSKPIGELIIYSFSLSKPIYVK